MPKVHKVESKVTQVDKVHKVLKELKVHKEPFRVM